MLEESLYKKKATADARSRSKEREAFDIKMPIIYNTSLNPEYKDEQSIWNMDRTLDGK